MRIAIVDDEVVWRTSVEALIKKYPWKEEIQIDLFCSGEEFCNEKDYDIVFMDIELGEMDGFEAVRLYKENNEDFILILFTVHAEMSRQGYLVDAFRYILKSNIVTELDEALKAIEILQARNYVIQFHVINKGEMYIKAKDILFVETEKRNVIIHTKEQSFISNRKLDELEKELKNLGFFRCHRSYLINLEHVYKYDKLNVYFKNGKKAFVSTRKYAELKERYFEQKFKTANS